MQGASNISEDARGRWYLKVTVKVAAKAKPRNPATVRSQAVGLDLGSQGATGQIRRGLMHVE